MAAVGLVVALATGGMAEAAGSGRITGAHFATKALPSWTVKRSTTAGGLSFKVASPDARLDGSAVPKAGGVGLTIVEATARALAKKHKRTALPSSPAAAFRLLVRPPAGATKIRGTAQPRPMTFHGSPAAKAGFIYTYNRRLIGQQAMLVLRGGRVYIIQSYAGTRDALSGTSSLVNITGSSWRWR